MPAPAPVDAVLLPPRRAVPEAMAIVDDVVGLSRILLRSHTIAVLGLSANWYRPSYFAAKYMQDRGYRIVPVNPNYGEVLGERCYPTLPDIPFKVDIVDCFRKPDEIPPIARDAVAIGAKVLWMQLGIRNAEAAKIAVDGGLDVVMNRCVKIEHARILGGLHWAGVNTGIISSSRPGSSAARTATDAARSGESRQTPRLDRPDG